MENTVDASTNAGSELDNFQPEALIGRMKELEEELADVIEQREVALSRPMRGAEKDALRRRFNRLEARLRESIEATKSGLNHE